MNEMLKAILDNDVEATKKLLAGERSLATWTFRTANLFRSSIFHWIYVGDTLLHLAAAGYRVEIIRLLLSSGADPNAAGNHRASSPLHYASDGHIACPVWDEERQVETIRCLLDGGANLHQQDKNGATPLHRAVRTRCAAAVRCLLDAGADATKQNKPGSTSFHLAVQNTGRGGSGALEAVDAQREIIREFLRRGVSPSLRSARGKTVLESAQSMWIRELLLERSSGSR
jgi:Ankyrin repeats (3 copies)/Ankyrin repeat